MKNGKLVNNQHLLVNEDFHHRCPNKRNMKTVIGIQALLKVLVSFNWLKFPDSFVTVLVSNRNGGLCVIDCSR